MSLLVVLANAFGPDNPNRGWVIGFTICLVACLCRNTRRLGGFGLFLVAGMLSVSTFIHNAYASFTPH
jgi:hypothetical protein